MSEQSSVNDQKIFLVNISKILQAADFLERREREAEHGYASPLPPHGDFLKRKHSKSRSRNFSDSRSSHNELEKNRRAHLRDCLEGLKSLVPVGPEGSRHTTLGLLTKAKGFIKTLENQDRVQLAAKRKLRREQSNLRKKIKSLQRTVVQRSIRKNSEGLTDSSEASDGVEFIVDVTGDTDANVDGTHVSTVTVSTVTVSYS